MANIYGDLWNLVNYGSQQDIGNQDIYKQLQDALKTSWGSNPDIANQLITSEGFTTDKLDWRVLYGLAKGFSDNPQVYDILIGILDKYAPSGSKSTDVQTAQPHLRGVPKTPITTPLPEGTTPVGEATAIEGMTPETPPVEVTTPAGGTDIFAGTPLAGLDLSVEFPNLTPEETANITKLVTESVGGDIEAQTKAVQGLIDLYSKYEGDVVQTPEQIMKTAQDMGALNWDSTIQSIDNAYKTNVTALTNQKGEVNAAYAGVYGQIQRGISAARQRTKEDMNARGLLFSGSLTNVLQGVEAAGLQLLGKTAAEQSAKLISIANNVAVLTANYTADQLKANTSKALYVGLQYMSMMTENKKEKQEIDLILTQLKGQLSTLDITKQSVIDKAISDALSGAETNKIENWATYMTIYDKHLTTVYDIVHTQTADALAQVQFDWSKEIGMKNYELALYKENNNVWATEAQLELGWANLTEEQRHNYIDEGIADRAQTLKEAQYVIDNNPDPTKMTVPQLITAMDKLKPIYVNIFKKDAKGNVVYQKLPDNTQTPIVEKQVAVYADEEIGDDGMPIIVKGGIRDTYAIYTNALGSKSQDLLPFATMDPTKFASYLHDKQRTTETLMNAQTLPTSEEQFAYKIASTYQFKFDNPDAVKGMMADLDALMKADTGHTVDWKVVMYMLETGARGEVGIGG